jgi:hypothetical protein
MIARGEIVEVVGPSSSGRTSLAMSWLRAATAAGATAALVDVDHAFDAAAARRGGVALERLLWIRCEGRHDVAVRATDLLIRCPGFTMIALDCGERSARLPLTIAFRFRHALRRTGATLLIVARHRVAGAGAGLAIEVTRRHVEWTGPAAQPRRLARVASGVRVLRRRAGVRVDDLDELAWWSA